MMMPTRSQKLVTATCSDLCVVLVSDTCLGQLRKLRRDNFIDSRRCFTHACIQELLIWPRHIEQCKDVSSLTNFDNDLGQKAREIGSKIAVSSKINNVRGFGLKGRLLTPSAEVACSCT